MSAIEALRTITAQAIGAAQVVMTDKRKQLFGDAMRQLTVDVSAGRSHSVAMSLRPDFDYEAGRGKCLHPDKLTGVAALVYQDCQVFSPTLEYWSKVVGDQREPWTEEGFNIVLHWSDIEDLLSRLATLQDDDTAAKVRKAIQTAQNAVTDKAKDVLGQLNTRAMSQALAGKSWAIAMSLKAGTDFEAPSRAPITQITPDWLGPVAKAVWDACCDYHPTFEYWSRQEGDQREPYTVEGINIVVHW
ncbi:MAG: hypothetical protein IPP97_07225 [Candidatus Obscuribacter sp.]|nr:hypothetical protein [Candidatus Obscuribacter sp.]MBP6348035.1 hypothetical protein [Candidatus Obscuribacter sp.]MBP6595392.1 hypothetical protein [Candidatus Obscuribacter sp.]MBP7575087.1 hypothetical protein [Candidatus Obscuribacter sp.]